MSNRTLIEINHDRAHEIDRYSQDFIRFLGQYLASGDINRYGPVLNQRFGVTIFGRRHHSDDFEIKYGAVDTYLLK